MSLPLVEITDENEILYRRVFYKHIKRKRVRLEAFKLRGPHELGVSVSLARYTTPEAILARGLPGQTLVMLQAQVPFALNLKILHAPEEDDPSHCLLVGDNSDDICDQLAAACELVPRPPSSLEPVGSG